MRTLAYVFAPFAAMLMGCQTSPDPVTKSKTESAVEAPGSIASEAAVPRFGPMSR